MDEFFKDASCDVEPWLRLREFLEVALRDLPLTDWEPELPKLTSALSNESERRILDSAILDDAQAKTDAAMLATTSRLRHGHRPEVTDETAYYLQVMGSSVIRFVESMVVKTDGKLKQYFVFRMPPTLRLLCGCSFRGGR